MPKISALGGMSSRGFGEFAQQTAANYIEDVFSTYLYTGNGTSQTITNNINLGDANVFSNTSTTALPAATNRSWTSLTYGNNSFLATSYQASSPFVGNTFAYSTDGITWTANTTPPNATWFGSAYGNGRFVAVSQSVPGYPSTAVYSSTASGTFTTATGFPSITTNNVRWVNDRFIATAQGGTTMAYSLTGTSWTSMTVPTGDWYDVAYGNGKWVCVSQTNSACITSTNGTTWTQSGTSINAYAITFGNGIFVATGANNTYTSSDGVTWTTVTSSCPINNGFQIIFDGTYFVVAGNSSSGVGIAYSTNATSWTFRPAPTTTFNGGIQAFVAYSGTIYSVISRSTQNYSATVNSLVPATIGDGGLVWMKGRSGATDHALYDTARGATFDLVSNTTAAQTTQSTGLTAFTASGFSIGALAKINTSAATYASWTFRKAPKFFDIVTYVGNGTSQSIPHNLGSVPGMIVVKRTSTAGSWAVYHRSIGAGQTLSLSETLAAGATTTFWNNTTPTATVFSLGANSTTNANGVSYVAYLFAHNAGGFGADGSQNVISCGSFTADGTGAASVTLGYEPQFIIAKTSSTTGGWFITDTMRGWSMTSDAYVYANTSGAEVTNTPNYWNPTATGFTCKAGCFPNSSTVVYIAIRRGPMRTPTSGTTVFDTATGGGSSTGNPLYKSATVPVIDASIQWYTPGYPGYPIWGSRLQGPNMMTSSSTAVETTDTAQQRWDYQNGMRYYASGGLTTSYGAWMWRRAPGFFDVTCYTGTGSATTQAHNLGVVPELMIVKSRTLASNWCVYSASLGATNALNLNNSNQYYFDFTWNSTSPTASVFSIGGSGLGVNNSGQTYVAYLFASCPGVSKIGSYTGTGATQTISCGFTGGARYVLIKRTDSTGDWWAWDTVRGMISGTDPRFALNSTGAQTNADWVYTTTGGFQIVTSDATVNASGGSYIYLAIA